MENSVAIGWMLPSFLSAGNHRVMVDVRAAEAGDEDFLFSVYASTRAEEMTRVNWSAEQQEAFLRMQFRAQSKFYVENYPGAEFQVITLNDQPIGRLYVHRRADEIRIMDIALLPDYRNLGIGSALLQSILEQGSNLGLPVTIHVEQFNPALHLYKRLGFQPKEDKGVYLLMQRSPASHEESGND